MKDLFPFIKKQFNVDKKLILIYCIVYFTWGFGMDQFGAWAEIAKFTYWWQIITCYILYMVPISLLLRGLPFHQQYAYGLISMCFLEFGGYAMESSYAYPNNLLDQFFGERNLALGMAMFFGLYFPLGNWGVGKIYNMLFKKKANNA